MVRTSTSEWSLDKMPLYVRESKINRGVLYLPKRALKAAGFQEDSTVLLIVERKGEIKIVGGGVE